MFFGIYSWSRLFLSLWLFNTFFFIKHYLKGSECALAALCTTSSLPVTVFLLSSALKLMNLAILRDPPVEIIGIISSLPVLNYRPVAIWMKRVVWVWFGRIMEGFTLVISPAFLGKGHIRALVWSSLPKLFQTFSEDSTLYVYLVECFRCFLRIRQWHK